SGVIFEDLINSGGSVLKGIDAVNETSSLKIVSVLSIVDYEFNVARNQIKKFCPQYSLVKLSDILEFMREEKMQGVEQLVSWHNSFYN
ncbi:MAG: hypothetical protein CME61_01835, partial [Halobacteriovoraceae bacterium]|nr:hypothetical protein [Halobacteriovoraceae bacterium]